MLKVINRTTQGFGGVVALLLFWSVPGAADDSEAAANRYEEVRDDPVKLRKRTPKQEAEYSAPSPGEA